MDIIAIGEPLLEFSTIGHAALDTAGQFATGFGGDTSNFLVAAARSGARTGYVTRVGTDPFGDAFLRLWEAEGIDTTHVVRADGERTGVYFISRDPARSVFTYYRADSAASRLSPADVPEPAVASARALHVSGITQAISVSACDAAFHAMTVARAAGTLVSYDPNYRPQLWPLERARAVVARSIELSDVVFPNIEEGRLLTGATDPTAVIDWYAARGPRTVVLKLGADGALLWHEATLTEIKPHPVTPLDSTGAGDAFDGAFMAHLTAGATPAEAAHYAAVAGALTTQGHGAVGPIPTRSTILAAD
ncbi:fructokinase-like protein [Asanoa ishikariensis]|uniref:2-keto-3-deoxygluconate kinase n=1 Tax=Asanoa ishikariensis TaxID=137265 RepID=A0A1H3S3J6_9ACTN|nr:sugar kinase [Asanoa ishikariensis]GIF66516.1 fructokinase-like protein [Asanoa ishikariensis]SDZ32663.1 2-keto-3-deoxygluconate kinase [Asanoa ishikariensis]